MNKKGIILCTVFLLSNNLGFAANGDTTGQGGANPPTNTSNGNTTTSTPAINATDPGSTSGTSKDSDAGAIKDSNTGSVKDTGKDASSNAVSTQSTDSQGTPTHATTNSNDAKVNKNVNANVTEVNNKAVIKGVTRAPTFTSVELRGNVHYLPSTVTPVRGFYFLSIQSIERVCSLKKIPKVKVLSTPTTVTVIIGQKKKVLYCYDRTYFSF